MGSVDESKMVKVLDYEKIVHYDCFLKHATATHSLGWEYVQTIVSKQYDKDDSEANLKKATLLASVTSDMEDEIVAFISTFCTSEVPADKLNGFAVDDEDIAQLVWIKGELVLSEIHLCQYISREVKHLQDAASTDEQNKRLDNIDGFLRLIHNSRTIRKKLFGAFYNKKESEK